MKQETPVEALADELYDKCYVGHVSQAWWLKLARWVKRYGNKRYKQGWQDALDAVKDLAKRKR